LFIDEIADMPRETQNKILRVLVDQTFQRVGGTTKVAVDVRIVSSTARNLEAESPKARSARICITGSRWCRSGCRRCPSGARTFPNWSTISWTRFRNRPACRNASIGADAMAVLQSHNWPGNVRQLRNNVERLMILAGGDPDASITPHAAAGCRLDGADDAERQWRRALMGLPLREAREVFEREYLVAQISRFGGNISRTAEFVGMERSALHRKLKALGIG
jgi:two-component system nitrogen regulation response regulator NtrX